MSVVTVENEALNRLLPDHEEEWTVDDLARMPDDGFRYELFDGVLVVSPRLARARVIDALHLCGYRRTRTVGARSVYAQRSEAERQAPPYHRGWRS